MIRPAEQKDISRITEILIFTKRTAYRPIFHNDKVSFGEMQVLPLAEEYLTHPKRLAHTWVYEEEFVKGLITLHCNDDTTLQIEELFVDVFFQHERIGSKLLSFAENMAREQGLTGMFLWVLEKNDRAREFYHRHGFIPNGDRQLEEGTPEYIVKYEKILA